MVSSTKSAKAALVAAVKWTVSRVHQGEAADGVCVPGFGLDIMPGAVYFGALFLETVNPFVRR